MSEEGLTALCCRICHCSEPVGDLISPCKCDGSLKLIHSDCLLSWLQFKKVDPLNAYCEVCLARYRIPTKFSFRSCLPIILSYIPKPALIVVYSFVQTLALLSVFLVTMFLHHSRLSQSLILISAAILSFCMLIWSKLSRILISTFLHVDFCFICSLIFSGPFSFSFSALLYSHFALFSTFGTAVLIVVYSKKYKIWRALLTEAEVYHTSIFRFFFSTANSPPICRALWPFLTYSGLFLILSFFTGIARFIFFIIFLIFSMTWNVVTYKRSESLIPSLTVHWFYSGWMLWTSFVFVWLRIKGKMTLFDLMIDRYWSFQSFSLYFTTFSLVSFPVLLILSWRLD
ncbi:hypothetical protein RCL1_002510 [Eukaryota sp. TZLM3-RCL]